MGFKVRCHYCNGEIIHVYLGKPTDTGFVHVYTRDDEVCSSPIPTGVAEAIANLNARREQNYLAEIEHLTNANRQLREDFSWVAIRCVPVKGSSTETVNHFWGLVEKYLMPEDI